MGDAFLNFPHVTLLITHYNRSRSLERLLNAFRERKILFADTVVSDDGSIEEHVTYLEHLQAVYGFNLITSPVNKGLGNNINKGQDAVKTDFTLYVQEDFVPKNDFAAVCEEALLLMQKKTTIDIVRLYAYFSYPYRKPFAKGFSEMIFHPMPWYTNHLKFYVYSDHPHLRRSNFLQKFGRYPEGIKGDDTEFGMALSFLKRRGKGLIYDDFTNVFDQLNSPGEPSTMQRSNWRQQKKIFVILLRAVYLSYRLLRNTGQYIKKK